MNIEQMERVKNLRDILRFGEYTEDEKRAYTIQLKTLLPNPTKTLYIDADSIIYKAGDYGKKEDIIDGDYVGELDTQSLDNSFNFIVKEIVDACKYNALLGDMVDFKDYVLVYTPSTNFRYTLDPNYKCSRENREDNPTIKYLKGKFKPMGMIVEGVEADDVVAYYARRGHPITSNDKDVINGVVGNNFFYHSKHMCVVKTTKEDANRFLMLQCVAGDPTDDIRGIQGVGMKTKLLPNNPTFYDVIKVYESHAKCHKCNKDVLIDKIDDIEFDGEIYGMCPKCKDKSGFYQYTENDAILTRRLVDLNQWRGPRNNKVVLFKYEQ